MGAERAEREREERMKKQQDFGGNDNVGGPRRFVRRESDYNRNDGGNRFVDNPRDGPRRFDGPRDGPRNVGRGSFDDRGPRNDRDFERGPPRGDNSRFDDRGPPRGRNDDFQRGPPRNDDFQRGPPRNNDDFQRGPPRNNDDF